MSSSTLFVETDRPARYVKQVASHLSSPKPAPDGGPDRPRFLVDAHSDGQSKTLMRTDDGESPVAGITTDLLVDEGNGVVVIHHATDLEELARLEQVVTGHLWRFIHGRDAEYPEHEHVED